MIPRKAAAGDVEDSIDNYLFERSARAALGFINAPEDARLHIGRQPASGSPRYAHELNLPGLRAGPLTRYAQIIFYVEHSAHIDIWRVLHGKRDVPQWMSEPPPIGLRRRSRVRAGRTQPNRKNRAAFLGSCAETDGLPES